MFFAPVLRTRAVAPSFRDSAFEQFFSTLGFQAKENETAWTVTLDLPGVSREDLDISIEGAVVSIQTKDTAKRKYKAAYEFGEEIDVDATTAALENGVLTLTLAKKKPVSKARTIEVK